jgi:cold shock protein
MTMGEERYVGQVKWFSNAKGYGFIQPDQGKQDVFVHYADIEMDGYKTLEEGVKVEFTLTGGQSDKGPRAQNVRRVNAEIE